MGAYVGVKSAERMGIMDKKYIASVSFGRDSLCMLFWLIETKAPLDTVLFYDFGMEFKALKSYGMCTFICPSIGRG